jgi:hypothetical protein
MAISATTMKRLVTSPRQLLPVGRHTLIPAAGSIENLVRVRVVGDGERACGSISSPANAAGSGRFQQVVPKTNLELEAVREAAPGRQRGGR